MPAALVALLPFGFLPALGSDYGSVVSALGSSPRVQAGLPLWLAGILLGGLLVRSGRAQETRALGSTWSEPRRWARHVSAALVVCSLGLFLPLNALLSGVLQEWPEQRMKPIPSVLVVLLLMVMAVALTALCVLLLIELWLSRRWRSALRVARE